MSKFSLLEAKTPRIPAKSLPADLARFLADARVNTLSVASGTVCNSKGPPCPLPPRLKTMAGGGVLCLIPISIIS